MKKIKHILMFLFFLFFLNVEGVFANVYTFKNNNGNPGLSTTSWKFSFGEKTEEFKLFNSPSVYFNYIIFQYNNLYDLNTSYNYMYFEPSIFANRNENEVILYNYIIDDRFINFSGSVIPYKGNHISYDKQNKTISACFGYNNNFSGRKNCEILYENIDKNTPNFLMLYRSATYSDRDNHGPTHNQYAYFYRETEPGNGILEKEIQVKFLAGLIPINQVLGGGNVKVFPGLTLFSYKTDKYYGGNELNEKLICYFLGNSSNKECINEISVQLTKLYLSAWKLDFGGQFDSKVNPDVNDPYYQFDEKDENYKNFIPKIKNIKPVAPTCSFSESFLGLSCLSEWILYGFDIVKYSIFTFVNTFIDFVNGIFNFFINIKNFFQEIIKILKGEVSFYNFISQNNSLNCNKDGYDYSVDVNSGTGGIVIPGLKPFLQTLSLGIPVVPDNGTNICTFAGMKTIKYRVNSVIDYIFIMIFGMGIIILFLKQNGNNT